MQVASKQFQGIAFLDQCSHRGTGNLRLVGTLHTQTNVASHNTDHEHPLFQISIFDLPQILIGASSSRRIGCDIKISLER